MTASAQGWRCGRAVRRAWWAATAALAALGLLALEQTARATVTCDYAQSGKILEVRITTPFAIAAVGRTGSDIVVATSGGAVACTSNPAGLTPTVTTRTSSRSPAIRG